MPWPCRCCFKVLRWYWPLCEEGGMHKVLSGDQKHSPLLYCTSCCFLLVLWCSVSAEGDVAQKQCSVGTGVDSCRSDVSALQITEWRLCFNDSQSPAVSVLLFASCLLRGVRSCTCVFVLAFMSRCARAALNTPSVIFCAAHWSWDLEALCSLCVIMWLRPIMCMQRVSIKLPRSKALPIHTHTLLALHYPPHSSHLSPPPLSLSLPFQQGNSMLSNFFQMSSTSLPPFSPALFPLF